MKKAIELIAEEQKRKIEIEGFDIHNDIESYQGGQLMGAAGCYISNALNKGINKPTFSKFEILHPDGFYTDAWPWDDQYDKREKHDAMRSLVIAGAFIADEIDRHNTLNPPTDEK